jgi:hypothetical protein
MVGVAQLVEPRVVIPVVVGSSPIVHPKTSKKTNCLYSRFTTNIYKTMQLFDNSTRFAKVAELVDALDLGSSGVTRESSSLSFRTISYINKKINILARHAAGQSNEGLLGERNTYLSPNRARRYIFLRAKYNQIQFPKR